jgi:tripartite-type tricarboxylate transporter receptor subunit TctC
MRVRIASCFVLVLSMLASTAAQAQSWPSRPVTVVVPFAAGVTGDIMARSLVEHLSAVLGQPFIVDNRSGAGGNVGGAAVAKAAPDGYTLLLSTTGPASINKLTYKTMSYDPQRDLAPIVLMGKAPVIIVGRNNLPAGTLKDFIESPSRIPPRSRRVIRATARRDTSAASCCSSVRG